MKSLQLLVEKSVVERYRVEVEDDFDETDQMLLQELFDEDAVIKREPHTSRVYDMSVTVEDDLQI